MKRKKLVFLGILMLFVATIVLAENQKKEIPVDEAMKCFCATWINPAYYEEDVPYSGKIVIKDGTLEQYKNETSQSPEYSDRYKIEKSWIDKDGNVWLNVLAEPLSHTKIRKKYLLAKISDDGNTLEFAYDWNAYPTVDPEPWPYYIMYKKQGFSIILNFLEPKFTNTSNNPGIIKRQKTL